MATDVESSTSTPRRMAEKAPSRADANPVGVSTATPAMTGSTRPSEEEADASSAPAATSATTARAKKRLPRCRFYQTKKGCRAGASCPFRHELIQTSHTGATAAQSGGGGPVEAGPAENASPQPSAITSTQSAAQQPQSSHVVARPIAEAEKSDPRSFQIKQMQRRFAPKDETASNGDTILHFGMTPSDPDFPFDINTLDCTLRVPSGFPSTKPSLRITNKEMERGYQLNVEHGFDVIWQQAAAPTLLNAFKTLDRQLEALLTAQKAEIIKIVTNASVRPAASSTKPATTAPLAPVSPKEPSHVEKPPAPSPKQPPISSQRRREARAKRDSEVQVLEHRLGRDSQFSKVADGTLFTVPLEPRKRDSLPLTLQAVKAVRLLVPLEYDIEPCILELLGIEGNDAVKVEEAFARRAQSHPDATLLAQVNYLAANMHLMVREVVPDQQIQPVAAQPPIQQVVEDKAPGDAPPNPTKQEFEIRETDKQHVKVISRPPEWDMGVPLDGDESDSDASSYSDGDYDSNTEDEDGENEPDSTIAPTSTPQEKGIMLSFPGLEIHGIELLELVSVCLTVKCDRCKDTLDVQRLRPLDEASTSTSDPTTKDHTMHASCKKCAYPFTLAYRKDILHANSTRAGYFDLDGCTVLDLLPSSFLPTCSSCSTPFPPSQPVTAVRAQSALAICRTCHAKLSFLIRENKFLRVSNTRGLPLKQVGRPKKENLGVVAGTELPDRGRCKHYSKSYRWFRFSCCNKVFPCDKCHDVAEDHPNEFANRMICGWCSREQGYRPEECGMQGCRRGITGRVRTGFWEGGKGTRDKARMSRKDPRKYKRRPGGTVKKT